MTDHVSAGFCRVCRQPTEQKCSSCKSVYYCTPEHQKGDWKEHKNQCRPFEICQSEVLGRYLRATRDLQEGDLIFSELPLVFGPKPHKIEAGPVPCVGCCRMINNEESFNQCPECLWPSCSPQCDGLKDKSRHALECRLLKFKILTQEARESFYDFFRFDILIVLRALFLQKVNKPKWEQLLKLEDHLDKRGPDTEIFKVVDEKSSFILSNFLQPLRALEQESGKAILEEFSSEIIHKIFAILDVNATELTDEIQAEILYPTASLMEHNCTPNTRQIISDDSNFKITVRAALPIKKHENITSIYTHILWGTHARRQHLKETKYFSCKCKRCQDPTEFGTFLSALRCLGTEAKYCGGTQLPVNPSDDDSSKIKWVCDRCKIQLPNDEIMSFVEHLGGEVEKVLEKKPKIQDLEELLEKLLKFLHPNHYHVYSVKHSLVQMFNKGDIELSNSFLNEKLEICRNLIEITEKIDPGNARLSLYLAVLLLELFDVKFLMLQRDVSDCSEDILHIIAKAKKTLEFENETGAGSKLFDVILQCEKKFGLWEAENKI